MGYEFDFSAIFEQIGLLARGAGLTLLLTALTATIGIALSIAGAATSRGGLGWARRLVAVYVEIIRNTPFIVQLFFIFFGLPSLGVHLTALTAAVLAMTINMTAYCIEIVRAGIEAIPPGQREAGIATGLKPIPVFALIVLPQAIAVVYPALVSQIVITMLESAVVSQIAVADLTHAADFIQSRSYRAFETYAIVTLIYLALALLLRWGFNLAGQRLFKGQQP